jgi:hypothetical protein
MLGPKINNVVKTSKLFFSILEVEVGIWIQVPMVFQRQERDVAKVGEIHINQMIYF